MVVEEDLSVTRIAGLALVFALAGVVAMTGQGPADAKLQSQLKALFPSASAFSPKEGSPPHYKVYVSDGRGGRRVGGYAFWTTELVPLERAYDGPIKILVGMDTVGVLAGVIVTEHREPYGNFSVDTAGFANQFKGKNIRDGFRYGEDVDAISRATISVTSASRAIRNSARRVAREYLTPEADK